MDGQTGRKIDRTFFPTYLQREREREKERKREENRDVAVVGSSCG
jgi:hypothetical protein